MSTSTEPNDFLEHKQTSILSLLWILVLHYQLNYTPKAGVAIETAIFVIKRSFLMWINSVLTDFTVTNLSTDWRDGRALAALIEYCKPGATSSSSYSASAKAGNAASNIQSLMHLAELHFNIPQVVSPNDFAADKPDERSVMMYLSYFVGAASGPGQATLLQWITEQVPDQRVTNLTSDWVDGRILGALTNAISGGKFGAFADMSPENAVRNIEQSMIGAEKLLGVRRTIKVEQFADTMLNGILRLSYLSQFYHAKMSNNAPSLIPPAPDKVEVSQVQVPDGVGDGKDVWVQLDCSDAGYGTPRAEVVGRNVGSVPVQINEIKGEEEGYGTDKYIVKFAPPKVDVYTFSIFYGDDHVTGSPFIVNLHPPNPEGVKHVKTDNPSEDSDHVAMTFNTKEAGRGKLKANAMGEIIGSVPIKINIESDGTYIITFVPPTPDVYTVDVLWGKFSAHAIGEACGPVPLQVDQDQKSEYKVSFKPPNPDVYVVDVNWEGKPVPGSPFTIDLLPPPQPEEVECAIPYYSSPGEQAELLVDASNAGSGKLKAHCIGEKTGEVAVMVTKVEGRTYQVNFNPPEQDLYTLSVLFDDKHVRGSPFTIDMRPGKEPEFGEIEGEPYPIEEMPDAAKCVLLEAPPIDVISPVDRPIYFSVDATDAGHAELEVNVEGPNVERNHTVEVNEKKEQKGIFDVTFIPHAAGPYTINLEWFGDSIPGAPLKCNAIDQATMQRFPNGKVIGYDVDIDCKLNELRAHAIHNPTGAQYKVKVAKVQKGKYKFTFTPKEPGIYRLHFFVRDKEAVESPILILYEKPPSAKDVVVSGLRSKCYIEEPMNFSVDASEAGTGTLIVRATCPRNKKDKSKLTVNNNGDGTYTVNYVPQTIGEHNFTVQWAGKAVPGSPFVTTAAKHVADMVGEVYFIDRRGLPTETRRSVPPGDENLSALLQTDTVLEIKTNDELKDAELDAVAVGETAGRVELVVTRPSDNVFSIALQPTVPDRYTITAKLAGQDVPRSPVMVTYIQPTSDASKCRLIGIDRLPSTLYATKPISFQVDASEAGPGELDVYAKAYGLEEPATVDVQSVEGDLKVFNITYIPAAPGNHKIHVLWDKGPVPDSPVNLQVSEAPNYAYGQPIGMDVNVDCKAADLTAHAIHLDTNTQYKVKITKVQKGKFKLTFQPKDYGYYHIFMFVKQVEVPGSPFVVYYRRPPQADKVFIRDISDHIYVGDDIHFTVDTTEAGSGVLNVKVSVPTGATNRDVRVNDNKDGTYDVELTTTVSGDHIFDVLWAEESVPGAPFKVPVREVKENVPEEEVVDFGPPVMEPVEMVKILEEEHIPGVPRPESPVTRPTEITVVIGKALRLKVRPQDEEQRHGKLETSVYGETTGDGEVSVTQGDDGVFEVYFNPDEPDHYVLNVQLNGENVPKSPFYVHYIPAPTPIVIPLEDIANLVFQPDQPVGYQIDLTGLDVDKLSARCVGVEVGEVKVDIVRDDFDPKKYKVNFTPPKPDLYRLSVFYNDSEVKNSPYIIDLREKIQEEVQREFIRADEAFKIPDMRESEEPEEEEIDEEPFQLDNLPTEEITNFIGRPTVVKVVPGSEAQRHGTIVATAIGEISGHTKVTTRQMPNDDYTVALNPHNPDRYKVDILLNDKQIPRSPFIVNYVLPPTDPSQCRIIDAEDIPLYLEVGQEVKVRVDAKKAGPGDFEVTADRPSAESEENPSMLAAGLVPGEKALYEVTYIPNSIGHHKLNLLWANENIPHSPVQLIVYDPAAVELHPHGKPVGVDVTTDAKQGDLRAHIVNKRTNSQHKVKLTKVQKGKYRFTFSPKEPGLYFLHIFAKDKEIPQSPIPIRYASPSKPEACVIIGLVDKCYLGETLKFVVDATQAGDGDLQVTFDRKDKGKVEIAEVSRATYSVEFTPTAPGSEKMHVTWSGKPVPNTPHTLLVKDHAEEELITWLFLQDRANERHPIDFPENELEVTMADTLLLRVMARTSEQKKGNFHVTATDLSTYKTARVTLSKESEDIFEAFFLPDTPHPYSITAKLNNELVPNTPFIVNYVAAPAVADNCKIIGLERLPPRFQVDKPINFQIDTRLAGDGKLNIAADCPQTKPVLEAKGSHDDPRIIDVEYIPTAPGTHNLKLSWSGEPIPKSPVTFEVEDIKVYPNGKPVGIDLDIDGKSSELEAYGVHVESNTRIKVKTNKLHKGRFNFTLRPKLPGLYALHILLKKKEISSSPIYFRYDYPPKPEAVVINNVPEECYLQEVYSFIVDATKAGMADLRVRVTSPSKGKDGELTVTDNHDGTHTVQHVPEVIGTHSFAVTWDGKPVPESPVKVMVNKRTPIVKHCFGPFVNVVHVGQPVYLQVVNVGKHVSSNFLQVELSAPDNDDKVTIEKQEDGNYSIKFVPTEPKDYSLTVKLHREAVGGSPFFVKAVESHSLKADFIHPDGIIHSDVEAGQPVCLLIPRDDSLPADTISVNTKGPYGPCETHVSDALESMYGLNFTPVFPGEYLVHVKQNEESDHEIEWSPFKVVAVKKETAAQKVFIPEKDLVIFADPIPLGVAINFDIDTRDAGYGTLKVRPQGVGEADIRLYDQGGGMYGCEVKPREQGHCQLDILWKDESIHDSPFTLMFCKVKGVVLEGQKFQTGSPYKFKVEHDQVLEGELEVICSEPTAAEVSITPLADLKAYECTLTPSQAGEYQMSVMYNGYHIEGSPFNVNFYPPPQTGVSFSFDAQGGEASDMSATVQSALNLEEIPVHLSQLFGGQYSIEFVPTQGLEYLVTIKCRVKIAAEQKEIAGSPFSLSYAKQLVDASKCILEFSGEADKVVVGAQNSFYVLTEGAGYGRLKVSIDGPDLRPDVRVRQVNASKTEVNYVVHHSGDYSISVTWDGEPIPGSPFEVHCISPEGLVSLFGQPNFPTEVAYGKPLHFSLKPQVEEEDKGGGELVVIAHSKMHGITPGTVEHRDGTYQCSIDLKHPGRYTVEVTWNGNPIAGTPFEVRVIQTPEPEKVVVQGPGLQDGYLGQQGNFTIETADAGSGTLSVNVEGPKGGFKINLSRDPENERTILADYNPQYAGQYIISIQWSNVSVPGSPFIVNIE